MSYLIYTAVAMPGISIAQDTICTLENSSPFRPEGATQAQRYMHVEKLESWENKEGRNQF